MIPNNSTYIYNIVYMFSFFGFIEFVFIGSYHNYILTFFYT